MTVPDLVVVLCAGNGDRWGGYLDRPKHLAVVDDEPILHRTVKQMRKRTTNVWVVAQDDRRYRGPLWHTLTVTPVPIDADKFWSSRQLWSGPRHVLFVMGDAWFSDAAAAQMTADYSDWVAFTRPGPSRVCPYGELFGFSIPATDQPRFEDRVLYTAGQNAMGVIPISNGWAVYHAMAPEGGHTVTFDEHDAEDFDTPQDYDLFTAYRQGSTIAQPG